ncbi:MAG: hypothetical protein J6A74_05385, partial [Oscillospiraceae bacterium]|nr:hypothetical protein [Oscillospiraceae bacterium]
YDGGRKVGELSLLACRISLEYDNGIPQNAVTALDALFHRPELILPKKTKSGIQDQDIIPMIRNIKIYEAGEDTVTLDCLICCQNPTLNPNQLTLAISSFAPEYAPSFSRCTRMEIYDAAQNIFR